MLFTETKLKGAFLIDPERMEDERGFFARSWSQQEFTEHGLDARLVECNISFNRSRGTLRGMHYQADPFAQAKLVRCTRGAIYDVIVDIRCDSLTFRDWTAVELTAQNRRMVYVPEGFAHGFLTLADETEVFYQMSALYHPESAREFKWNDPTFNIIWPGLPDTIIMSEKDRSSAAYSGPF